jgi:4-hydroxyphenylpyruvate dioxygenase-like putative hemolysin
MTIRQKKDRLQEYLMQHPARLLAMGWDVQDIVASIRSMAHATIHTPHTTRHTKAHA